MSASADNSMWSPVNESYALKTYPYGIPRTSDEIKIEYPPPEEPNYDPLIAIPPTEAEREGVSQHCTHSSPMTEELP
jgi:hypothetical protein